MKKNTGILNYRQISLELAGNTTSITQKHTTKQYKERVSELEKLVEGWSNGVKYVELDKIKALLDQNLANTREILLLLQGETD